MGPPESYLYAFDNTVRSSTTCVHNNLTQVSCPECGTSADIVMVEDGGAPAHTPAMVTATSLERLRAWHSRVETVEDLEGNVIYGPPAPSKDEKEEAERRATFGEGGGVGRTHRCGRPVKGLTRAARSRPSTAPLPPLDASVTGGHDESAQWEFSVLGSAFSNTSVSSVEVSRKAAPDGATSRRRTKRRHRRRVWKSPYHSVEASSSRLSRDAPCVLRPVRTTPSFGGGQADKLDLTASGNGLVIPPHLLRTLLDVEALLDEGNVGGALSCIRARWYSDLDTESHSCDQRGAVVL